MKYRTFLGSFLLFYSAQSAFATENDFFEVQKNIQEPMTVCQIKATQKKLHLADLINIALCQNPETKRLYMATLATASELGQVKSSYLPSVDLSLKLNQSDTEFSKGNGVNSSKASAGLAADWLIYDFGGRSSSVNMAKQALNIAMETRSDALQSLIFQVIEAYYLVFAAKEEVKNANETVTSAFSAYKAASKRYELGLSALSDKLQAETSYSEAQLTQTKAQELLALTQGNLSVLLNLSPNEKLDLQDSPFLVENFEVNQEVEKLFAQALENRSDIKAQKAAIKRAEFDVDYQKSQNAPSISVTAGLDAGEQLNSKNYDSLSSSIGVSLNVPLFTGFKNTYKTSQARYAYEAEKAKLQTLENEIRKEVWTSFQSFYTAKKTHEISLTAFASADQNAKVALGAYEAGMGNILNVLDAQSKLASTRSSKSRSFYELLIAKTNIIRKIGQINPFTAQKGF